MVAGTVPRGFAGLHVADGELVAPRGGQIPPGVAYVIDAVTLAVPTARALLFAVLTGFGVGAAHVGAVRAPMAARFRNRNIDQDGDAECK